MTSLRVLFCVLALAIVAVAAADPQPFTATVTGSTVNGTYVSYPTVAVTTPDTLAGTVTVALSPDTQISAAVTVCFSANPIFSASNLAALCPQGGLVTVSNNTAALVEVKFARKSFSAFSSTKRLSGRFAQKADEVLDTTNTVTLLPATSYFVVFATGTTSEDVSLTLSGATCAQGEVGPACITPAPIAANDTAPVEVGPNAYTYFMVDPTTFDASVGSVTYALGAAPTAAAGVAAAAAAPAGLALFAQVGTLPTSASAAQVIGSGSTITIESPSTLSGTLYIGVQNTGAAATNATLTSTANSCPANTYGASCTPLSSIALLSAALSTNVQKLSKSSSTTNPLVSFQVDTTTIPAGAAAVRVSVSSSTSTTADAVYAKLGSPPTVTDYAYRVSGGYVNQLVLLVPAAPPAAADNFNASAWYVAVDATNDYSIWAGNNCAGNCNSWNQTSTANNNGYCVCNGAPCDATTSYEVPAPNAVDSFGVCQCKDTKKQNNYDCSALVETSSPFKTVYIVLIAVGGAIVLAVAIGVPVYCYLQNRKRDYERL